MKFKELTPVETKFLLTKLKYTHTEYNHIFLLLATHILAITHIPLINKLLNMPYPIIYCFEVKKLLQENDTDLYKRYMNRFLQNAGCNEAFNIESENRKPFIKEEIRHEIKMLEPVYKIKKKKSRDNEKKQIRRNTRIVADKKIKELIEDGKEYKKKLAKMYAKIASNK